MGFPTLEYGLDLGGPVGLQVGGGDLLRGGIHDHVHLVEQIRQGAGQGHPGRLHRGARVVGGREHIYAEPGCSPYVPVRGDVRHPDEVHVRHCPDGVRDPLADHSVAVDGNLDIHNSLQCLFRVVCSLNLGSWSMGSAGEGQAARYRQLLGCR